MIKGHYPPNNINPSEKDYLQLREEKKGSSLLEFEITSKRKTTKRIGRATWPCNG